MLVNENRLILESSLKGKQLGALILLLFVVTTFLNGCALQQSKTAETEPVKKKVITKKKKSGKVIILVSNSLPAFTDVAKLPDALAYFNSHWFADKTIPIKLHMGEKKNQYLLK